MTKKRWHDNRKRRRRPVKVEGRSFAENCPPLQVGKTVLVCLSKQDTEDPRIAEAMKQVSDSGNLTTLFEAFTDLCDVGRLVRRTDDTVIIDTGNGLEVEHTLDEIVACMDTPKGEEGTRR